jgi:hypothetical protein
VLLLRRQSKGFTRDASKQRAVVMSGAGARAEQRGHTPAPAPSSAAEPDEVRVCAARRHGTCGHSACTLMTCRTPLHSRAELGVCARCKRVMAVRQSDVALFILPVQLARLAVWHRPAVRAP